MPEIDELPPSQKQPLGDIVRDPDSSDIVLEPDDWVEDVRVVND